MIMYYKEILYILDHNSSLYSLTINDI